MKGKLRSALRDFYHFLVFCRRRWTLEPEMEVVYRSLFLRNLENLAVQDEFFPVKGAANHSLLYLISRCLIEFPISKVLEFGAGQTSVLLDRVSARFPDRQWEITTVEQDPFWVGRIGQAVHHRVIHAPLTEKNVAGRKIRFYDFDQAKSQTGIELAIVDGPTADSHANQWNRTGAAGYLKDWLAGDFIVIFDDAERVGERAGADMLAESLEAKKIRFFASTTRAEKQQRLLCSEKFRAAAYF